MIKAKVNGTPVEIETSWEEVSFGKFLQLLEAKDDYYQIIAILLKLPLEDVRKAEISGLENVIQAINFLKTPCAIDEQPTKVGAFELPKDITFHSIEQFETLRQEIVKAAGKDNLNEQTKALAMYAAIYCQPLRGDAFDPEKAEYLSHSFMDYPCMEVMAAGSFFMARCLSLTSGLPMSYLRKNTVLKKKPRALDGFLRRSGFTRLSTISRAIWASLTRKR
jgi:hypothetical protein